MNGEVSEEYRSRSGIAEPFDQFVASYTDYRVLTASSPVSFSQAPGIADCASSDNAVGVVYTLSGYFTTSNCSIFNLSVSMFRRPYLLSLTPSVVQIRERNQPLTTNAEINLFLFSVDSYGNLAQEQVVELYRLLKLKCSGNVDRSETVSGTLCMETSQK